MEGHALFHDAGVGDPASEAEVNKASTTEDHTRKLAH